MARFVDAIDLPIPIEEAFEYLADFSRTAEWDPGVEEARRITRGKVKLGSRFEVTICFLGRRIPLEYQVAEFDPPSHLVLCGGDSSLHAVDEISFVARPGGSRVTYEARLDLVGLRQLADPILDLLFQRIGRLAVRGLRERLVEAGSRVTRHESPSKREHRPATRIRKRAKNGRKAQSIQRKEGVA